MNVTTFNSNQINWGEVGIIVSGSKDWHRIEQLSQLRKDQARVTSDMRSGYENNISNLALICEGYVVPEPAKAMLFPKWRLQHRHHHRASVIKQGHVDDNDSSPRVVWMSRQIRWTRPQAFRLLRHFNGTCKARRLKPKKSCRQHRRPCQAGFK
jgi:hypothetical protein